MFNIDFVEISFVHCTSSIKPFCQWSTEIVEKTGIAIDYLRCCVIDFLIIVIFFVPSQFWNLWPFINLVNENLSHWEIIYRILTHTPGVCSCSISFSFSRSPFIPLYLLFSFSSWGDSVFQHKLNIQLHFHIVCTR